METTQQTKNKKKIIIGVIAVLVLIAAAAAFIVLRETPEEKLQKYLDLGSKYLEEQDYENAIAAYDSALEIDPNHAEAIEGEVNAYIGWSDVLVAAEDYDKALEILNEGYEKFKDDDRLLSSIEKVEATIKVADIHDDLIALIKQAYDLCNSEDYLGVAQLLTDSSDLLADLQSAGMDRYIYDNLDECSAGIYVIDGNYYLYVGDFVDGIRQGQATWVMNYHSDYDEYAYSIGQWSGDMPNGEQTTYAHHSEVVAEANYTRGTKGTVVNGIFDGDAIRFFGDNSEFSVVFDNGVFTALEPEDETTTSIVVGLPLDGTTGYLATEELDDEVCGLPGFAETW